MIEGLIGRKIGMTQLFEDNGKVTPVTVIEAGPCVVVQKKTSEKDGYDAVQLGLVDPKAAKKANKPQKGHHEKAGVPPTRLRREFPLVGDADADDAPKPGDAIAVDIFEGIVKVDVIGVSKGKGFQGVIKRHGFGGGNASHGSMFHRSPGSIGQSATPSKVMKGMKGPGQMGNKRITCKGLTVVRVDSEKNLLLVRGSVPGAPGSAVVVRRSLSDTGTGAKD
ncbi:MAG: 50S ribosomal protein L3 [Acidobacteriota bacterium]|nr:50S ribosomal protein L3 [Acidobacteriota bacterium]MDH3786060.1 50S ribosomal protein L3 [Acidobacteriota bacterium]